MKRFPTAFIVIVVSLIIAGTLAVLIYNASLPDVAFRNAFGTFLIIFVPLVYIGDHYSKRIP